MPSAPVRVGRRARARRFSAVVGLLALSTLLALMAAEGLARHYGQWPRVANPGLEPPIHVPDPVIGWRPIPGHYQFGPYSPGAPAVDVTIRADGARETGIGPVPGRPRVVLVGCSFTMGWAVSDSETWAWRLQELRPDLEIVNHGVGGYGTVQAEMLLEELFRREASRPPARVLYGFIDHGGRNIASPLWLWALSFNSRAAATPYCTVTPEGRLERHPPEAYPSLPFHEYLASIALLERTLMQWRAAGRQRNGQTVTQLLMSEMAERCRGAGVGFSLVLLSIPEAVKAAYVPYAQQHQIDVIDCNQPKTTPVPGEVHPDAATHRRWGDCIAAALADPSRLPPETPRSNARADASLATHTWLR